MFRFRDISITKKLFLIMMIMAVLVTAEIVVLSYTIKVFSAVRSYVAGEGLWSKAQKNAAYYLIKYSYTHKEEDYQDYLKFLQVPLSDRMARLALISQPMNYQAAREGLQGGRIHPDDIDGVIWLFSTFHELEYIKKAMSIWTQADQLMDEFVKVGDQIHKLVISEQATPAEIVKKVDLMDMLNDRLTIVEDEFSYTLGEASRWLENGILKIIITMAIIVELTGLFLTILIGLRMSREINAINKVAKGISESDYSQHVVVRSHDEIGRLAASFNIMIDDLKNNINQKKYLENKDQVVSHMSHELRTLLNGIITLTKFLMQSNLTSEQLEKLTIIDRSNEQLLLMIDQILDFSKIESGQLEVDSMKVELHGWVNQVIAAYIIKAKSKEVTVSYLIEDDVPKYIIGDPVKIRQVLSNLLDNAVKFTEEGNVQLNISTRDRDGMHINLVFEVIDTGIGIPTDILPKLFSPFIQGDPSISTKYGGTGLGLAISKKLAELMGGSITVASSRGCTRFTFIVPSKMSE